MAGFTRTNGDLLPVSAYDALTVGDNTSVIGNGYLNPGSITSISSANTVQAQGPQLQFFTLTGNGSQIADNINAVFQTVQQLATVYMYEYTNATDDTLAIAVYPTGAWTTTTLDDALTNAWSSANVSVAASATFTN